METSSLTDKPQESQKEKNLFSFISCLSLVFELQVSKYR